MASKPAETLAYEVPAAMTPPAVSRPSDIDPRYANNRGNQPEMAYGVSAAKPVSAESHDNSALEAHQQRQPNPGPLRLRGYEHIFDPYTVFKWASPHFYRKPGLGYVKLAKYRHVDWFDREWTGDNDDRYISAMDGRASKLVVQAVDDIYDNTLNSTWRRTFIRNVSPLYLRLANWLFNHVDYHRNGKPTSEDYPLIYIKWFFACIAISFVVGDPRRKTPSFRNNGMYDPFKYRYIGYSKVSRNALEMASPGGHYHSSPNPIMERVLRPRYLCFLREYGQPAMCMRVEDWIQQYNAEKDLSYLFVAYTAEQFQTAEDLRVLHQIADAAARNASVPAYWIGCSCMPDDQLQEDVYRICDVIRGAHSLAIAVGRPANDMHRINTTNLMLQQWGERIWTFPEVLLSPAGKNISVYTRGSNLSQPMVVAKNQFAPIVWKEDAGVARQLVDHYEGNLILSQLELVTLALQCLQKRQTTLYFLGDHSYALMGLLRTRPQVDPTDSAFQAFARLSLANNSDQLLERLICVLPKSPDQPWHSMDDAYGAKLWEILPQETNIASIGHDDTVILDGCRGANVRWKSFVPVAHNQIFSFKRLLAQILLHCSGYAFWIAIALLALGPGFLVVGVILLIYSLIFIALSPYLLRLLYMGKLWGTQGWFFGFEGYMDIHTIEQQIFGARLGRMTWSPYSSPLSRHKKNEHGECVPLDPTTDPKTRALVEKCRNARPGEQRIFTLVDTGSMTATLFLAARPPVCFLLAGSEGGMQRAIGCSYDWTTATLYRETVLRMETPIQDSMFRVNRVKIGFNRPQSQWGHLNEVGEPEGKEVA